MKYPYFRGLEADRYSFYRVPKALIKVDLFEKMSGDAKLLYAVLLDRMNLSLKNGWQDENGNAYIICTIDEIMDSIRCARQKAVKLLDELEHEYQLVERRRQGLGKPNLLYVKDLYADKCIGFCIEEDGGFVGMYELVVNDKVQRENINSINYFRDDKLVQQAISDMEKLMAARQQNKEQERSSTKKSVLDALHSLKAKKQEQPAQEQDKPKKAKTKGMEL